MTYMKFFKTLLASILGTLIGLSLILLILFVIGISSSGEPEPYIKDQSVLHIELSGGIPDRTPSDPFQKIFQPQGVNTVSLEGLKSNLIKASSDDRISGILLSISTVSGSWAKMEEINKLISHFKDSTDKFIYATTNDIGYSEKGYFLATATDSIFSPPESFFEFDGFYIQTSFYDKMFKEFGIEPEITRSGKFKSAVEPYFRKDYSKENELQLNAILDGFSQTYVQQVAKATGKSIQEVNNLLNSAPSLSMDRAFEDGLVHQALYSNELDSLLKNRVGLNADDELNKVDYERYAKVTKESAGISTESSSNKIAVLHASGTILPVAPEGFPGADQAVITADKIRKELDDIRADDDIKALVIRINSPGGAGTTSDLIWQMLRETSKEMPVIASMGSVAASGGYYIAMAADTIVALPTTITGSIGVFNTKFNTRELFSDKIGITFDVVESHEHANWLNPQHPFTDVEQQAFQRTADQFYQTFIEKVAMSRGLTVDEVDERGQGRVWIGTDAIDQKLVDILGGLDKAIILAAESAKLDNYNVVSYPAPKDIFEILYGSGMSKAQSLISTSNPYTDFLQPVQDMFMLKSGQPMTLMPYRLEIK